MRGAAQVDARVWRHPDLAECIRVVNLVRDRRAIYSSSRGLRWCTDHESCGSAAALCTQMRSDLDEFSYLDNHTSANADDLRNADSTKRNTKQVAGACRRKLSKKQIEAIEQTCGDVLQRLNTNACSFVAQVNL
ncbi:uncharacterized protein LOC144124060 [Amblyomma americanum]